MNGEWLHQCPLMKSTSHLNGLILLVYICFVNSFSIHHFGSNESESESVDGRASKAKNMDKLYKSPKIYICTF